MKKLLAVVVSACKKLLVISVLLVSLLLATSYGINAYEDFLRDKAREDAPQYARLAGQEIADRWECLSTDDEKNAFVLSLINRFAPHDYEIIRAGQAIKQEQEKKRELGTLTVAERDMLESGYHYVPNRVAYPNACRSSPSFCADGQELARAPSDTFTYPIGKVTDINVRLSDGTLSVTYQDGYSRWQLPTWETNIKRCARLHGVERELNLELYQSLMQPCLQGFRPPLEWEYVNMDSSQRKQAMNRLYDYDLVRSDAARKAKTAIAQMPAHEIVKGTEEREQEKLRKKLLCERR